MLKIRGGTGTRRLVSWLSVLTLLGLFVVNTVGFIDTETGSAFGCGHDWPLCNGAVIPSVWGLHTLIEFMHRGMVGLVTVLLLVLAAVAWRVYGYWLEVRVLLSLSVGFVFLEAALGAIGVIFGDPPAELATHFGVSLAAFIGVVLTASVIRQIEQRQRLPQPTTVLRDALDDRRLTRWIWFAIVYLYVAMYFGAYVSSSGAGALFRGWPFPTERFADVHFAFVLDVLHRVFALGLILIIVMIARLTRAHRSARPELYRASLTALVCVALQAVSGAVLIFSHLSLWAFVLHVSIVTGLFAALSYLGLQVLPEPTRKRPVAATPE